MWWLHLARGALLVSLLAVSVFLSSFSTASRAASYTVPQVAKVTLTVPASAYTPAVHLLCLVRAQQDANEVTARQMCYSSRKPSQPPSLPISNFQAARHQTLVGALTGDGAWLVPVFDCAEFSPGVLAMSLALGIQLDKSGGQASGSAVLVTDTTAPLDCEPGPGTETTEGPLTLTPLDDDHDEDGDGCPDKDELGDGAGAGGKRDPFNKWDYFNPTNDGRNRSDDILLIVNHYRDDEWPPDGGYDVKYDRTGGPGPNEWNLGPPNGSIRSADINAIVNQYQHDCGDGSVWPPKPTPWPTPQ